MGARGSVATTAISGAAGLAAGHLAPTGLVTSLEPMKSAPLARFENLVFGGHDVTEVPLLKKAATLAEEGVIPRGLPESATDKLAAADAEIRPGISTKEAAEGPMAAVRRAREDLSVFRKAHELDRVVVVDVSSTEPQAPPNPAHASLGALKDALEGGEAVLPPSSLYAFAAFEEGCSFVEFTPSTGARLPALEELARERGVPHAGSDGKTGETLVKSMLAPMFAHRALKVRSWAGMNLLGGGDGEALADPDRVRSKLESKEAGLEKMLGYEVEAPVIIQNVRDMGEWKTAWDHVSFEGFMGARMRMQFVWEGCDSALAAPLVLDLARLTAHAHARGEKGSVAPLAFFFKDPIGTEEHGLDRQFTMLQNWITKPEEGG